MAFAVQLLFVDEADGGNPIGLQALQKTGGHVLERGVVVPRHGGVGEVVEGDRDGLLRRHLRSRQMRQEQKDEQQPACHACLECTLHGAGSAATQKRRVRLSSTMCERYPLVAPPP